MTTSNGYVGRWQLPSFDLIMESVIEPNASYFGLDFYQSDNNQDTYSVALAGFQKDPEGPEGMDQVKVTRVLSMRN